LTVIVESNRIIDGQPLDLTAQLQQLTGDGWDVRFMLPNGINRWTVIASRDHEIIRVGPGVLQDGTTPERMR
jgi:hypothetical protein